MKICFTSVPYTICNRAVSCVLPGHHFTFLLWHIKGRSVNLCQIPYTGLYGAVSRVTISRQPYLLYNDGAIDDQKLDPYKSGNG